MPSPPSLMPCVNLESPSVPIWTNSLRVGERLSEIAIWAPSSADWNLTTSPSRLSSWVSAISCAAPLEFPIAAVSSSNLFLDVPIRAFAAAKSVLLKIPLIIASLEACVIPSILACNWSIISGRALMFPAESYMSLYVIPSLASAAVPSLVGVCNAKSIFLKWVPPSAPLIPLSARTPRTVESSVVPPARFLAVAPMVRNASPSWATEVLDFEDAFAIWSTMTVVPSRDSPKADCASVTISDACARSIPPAEARFRTFGSISIDVVASYPASAM